MSLATCALLLAVLPLVHRSAPPPRADVYGDPLPPGTIARIGSVRLRHLRLGDFVCLPDGKQVVTAGGDRILRFWDLLSGRQVREVALQGNVVSTTQVTLSPDGKTLAAREGRSL